MVRVLLLFFLFNTFISVLGKKSVLKFTFLSLDEVFKSGGGIVPTPPHIYTRDVWQLIVGYF